MMQSKRIGWLLLLLIWAGVVLACNLPLAPQAQPLMPPTLPPESAEAGNESTGVENSVGEANPTPNATATLLPTSGESTEETLVLAPTVTPRATPGGVESSAGESGPLELEYEISWELNSADTAFALATVTLNATGGDGEYTFFRDDIPTGGSQFVYRWGSCKTNPGSFRVDSGDGQSVKLDYYEESPCP